MIISITTRRSSLNDHRASSNTLKWVANVAPYNSSESGFPPASPKLDKDSSMLIFQHWKYTISIPLHPRNSMFPSDIDCLQTVSVAASKYNVLKVLESLLIGNLVRKSKLGTLKGSTASLGLIPDVTPSSSRPYSASAVHEAVFQEND